MAFYTNLTRHESVLTIRVVVANDLKNAIRIGLPESFRSREVALGYNDIIVPAGETVELADGVEVNFVGARSTI